MAAAALLAVLVPTGSARSGTITSSGDEIRQTTTIKRDSATLRINPSSCCLPGAGVSQRKIRVTTHAPWTATANRAWITITAGRSGSGNGTVIFNVASNAGRARSGKITVSIGSTRRTFRVNQWPAATHPRVSADGDFDGDSQADMVAFQPNTGRWTVLFSSGTHWRFQFGSSTPAVPVPADFDGDGLLDVAIYRRSTGNWFILYSSTGRASKRHLGGRSAIPVPGDYDGDGKADLAVFRQTNGRWYFRCSTAGAYSAQWGFSGCVPVPADYDGDGRTDLAVYQPAKGTWQILRSSDGQAWRTRLGSKRTLPVPADYDGDGKADIAIYHPGSGNWRVRQSTTGHTTKKHLGWRSTIPVPADYDGDGLTDFAAQHASSRSWYILQSTTGSLITERLGGSNINFAVISDPHVRLPGNPDDADYDNAANLDHLRQAVAAINRASPAPSFVVVTGDLVGCLFSDNPNDYAISNNTPADRFRSLMNGLNCPWFAALGNHDYQSGYDPAAQAGITAADPARMEAIWRRVLGFASTNAFSFGGLRFIVLNSNRGPLARRPCDGSGPELGCTGSFDETQLAWLERELDQGEPSVLFLHHPLMTDHNATANWAYGEGSYQIPRSDGFYDVARKHRESIRAVFVGHGHAQASDTLLGTIQVYETANLGDWFGSPQALRIVTIDPATLAIDPGD